MELTIDKAILKITAVKNPLTANPVTRESTNIIINAFTTTLKSPKVKSVIGSVRRVRIGFTTVLIMPRTAATIRAVFKSVTETPGKIRDAIKTASPLMSQFIKSLILKFYSIAVIKIK